MATIKAGTYRFNDVLTATSALPIGQSMTFTTPLVDSEMGFNHIFTCNSLSFGNALDTDGSPMILCNAISIEPTIDAIPFPYDWYPYGKDGWVNSDAQTITIASDTVVSDEFYAWFTANAVSQGADVSTTTVITYKGSTIATLEGGKTATLKCKGMKMESDVVVKAASGGGSCSGNRVIEVDYLPTENIDEDALYLCNGSYYKYSNEISDVVLGYGGQVASSFAQEMGASFYIIPTKTTENILVSGEQGLYVYYIMDENNLFLYGDFTETGVNQWVLLTELFGGQYPFIGVVTDVSETTEMGLYAITEEWSTYIQPTGTLEITENGTKDVESYGSVVVNVPIPDGYVQPSGDLEITSNGTKDVTNYASVTVNVVTTFVAKTEAELPTDATDGTWAIVWNE